MQIYNNCFSSPNIWVHYYPYMGMIMMILIAIAGAKAFNKHWNPKRKKWIIKTNPRFKNISWFITIDAMILTESILTESGDRVPQYLFNGFGPYGPGAAALTVVLLIIATLSILYATYLAAAIIKLLIVKYTINKQQQNSKKKEEEVMK